MNRREFLKKAAISSGAALTLPALVGAPLVTGRSDRLGAILPMRPFGKTGEFVTTFCLGGAHMARAESEYEVQKIIETSIEKGVRLFDNASVYGRGRAEALYGKYLTPKYRDEVFIYTKSKSYTAADAQLHLENSLRAMKMDQLDLWMMHEVRTVEDVEGRFDQGILEVMLKAKEQGKVRHLGFSGHKYATAHQLVLKNVEADDPFVCCQLPINPVDASRPDSFGNTVVPDLVEKGYAIFAMKTLAHGRFFKNNRDGAVFDDYVIPKYLSLEEVFWWVLSQPVTTLVSGCETAELVAENVDIVSRFSKLTKEDQLVIVEKVNRFMNDPKLQYFRPKLES